MSRFSLTLLGLLLLLPGCPAAPPGGGTGDGGLPELDAGPPPELDAGPPPALDGGPPPELDAGTDAGPPPVTCECPALPETCVPPVPDVPAFSTEGNELIEQLFSVLSCATTSLVIAAYEMERECVVDAILARLDAEPGLTVSIVADDDRCPRGAGGVLECGLSRLEGHERVSIRFDERSGLMHDKLVIADSSRAWISSANFTERSFCTDLNDGIVVTEDSIVDAYEAELARMFVDGSFGPIDPEPVPPSAGLYTVGFSPRSPVSSPSPWFNAILDAIDATVSGETIEVMISAWTRTEISAALIAANERGVEVRILVSHLYADDPPAQLSLASGIEVRVANVHMKTVVLGGHTVFTGSANWSQNAWSNNENSLRIDDPAVAAAYQAEFERIFAASDPVTPAG